QIALALWPTAHQTIRRSRRPRRTARLSGRCRSYPLMLRIDQSAPEGILLRVAALLCPTVLLALAFNHATGDVTWWLAAGIILQVVAILGAVSMSRGLPLIGVAVFATWPLAWILVGLISLFTLGDALRDDWVFAVLNGLLPLPLLAVISAFVVRQSGALLIQQARYVSQQILSKRDWPADLQ